MMNINKIFLIFAANDQKYFLISLEIGYFIRTLFVSGVSLVYFQGYFELQKLYNDIIF